MRCPNREGEAAVASAGRLDADEGTGRQEIQRHGRLLQTSPRRTGITGFIQP